MSQPESCEDFLAASQPARSLACFFRCDPSPLLLQFAYRLASAAFLALAGAIGTQFVTKPLPITPAALLAVAFVAALIALAAALLHRFRSTSRSESLEAIIFSALAFLAVVAFRLYSHMPIGNEVLACLTLNFDDKLLRTAARLVVLALAFWLLAGLLLSPRRAEPQ